MLELIVRILARLARVTGRTPDLGRAGEREAARMLRRSGYRILGRNIRLRVGEADLVCLAPDRRTVVVVEVKSRLRKQGASAQSRAIAPEAAIHQHKRRKLLAVTRSLIRLKGWTDRPVRIDVVAVEWSSPGAAPVLRHHVNAVSGR